MGRIPHVPFSARKSENLDCGGVVFADHAWGYAQLTREVNYIKVSPYGRIEKWDNPPGRKCRLLIPYSGILSNSCHAGEAHLDRQGRGMQKTSTEP